MDKKETKRKKKLDKKHKHYSKISFQRKYQEKFLGSRGLKLAKLYEPKNFWIQVLLVTFLSIVVAFLSKSL